MCRPQGARANQIDFPRTLQNAIHIYTLARLEIKHACSGNLYIWFSADYVRDPPSRAKANDHMGINLI
jgi:hypothetical protein